MELLLANAGRGVGGPFLEQDFDQVSTPSRLRSATSLPIRKELKDSGVTVTCRMLGVTETEFFERAHMTDTKVGQYEKDDAMVAKEGFKATMDW